MHEIEIPPAATDYPVQRGMSVCLYVSMLRTCMRPAKTAKRFDVVTCGVKEHCIGCGFLVSCKKWYPIYHVMGLK